MISSGEIDGAGLTAFEDGAFEHQQAKAPVVSGFMAYFPGAIAEVAKVSAAGNLQHGTQGWDRSKSKDELNALGRHLLEHTRGNLRDKDGTLHLAKVAWRAMAALERLLDA